MKKSFSPNLSRETEFVPKLGESRARAASGASRNNFLFSLRARGGKKQALYTPRRFYQKVLFKARFVRLRRKDPLSALRAHIRYLERSGTGEDGDRPQFFSKEKYLTREELGLERFQNDPHHFRFIISPQKGAELSLEEYTRRILCEAERELQTKLEWTAVCHYNTANPHIHVLLRGRKADGDPLFIPKEFIKRRFRRICEREATKILGFREDRELFIERETALRGNMLLGIDKTLVEEQRLNGVVRIAEKGEKRRHKIIRLQHLCSLGMCSEELTGQYVLREDLEETLRTLSKRAALQERLSASFEGYDPKRSVKILGEDLQLQENLLGKALGRARLSELDDNEALLVDTIAHEQLLIRAPFVENPRKAKTGNILSIEQENGTCRVTILSDLTLKQQILSPGLTWLDLQPANLAYTGFASELYQAKKERCERLKALGYDEKRFSDLERLYRLEKHAHGVTAHIPSGRRIIGEVVRYHFGPLGEEVHLRTSDGLIALLLERRAYRPEIGAEIECRVSPESCSGLPTQRMSDVRVMKRERCL